MDDTEDPIDLIDLLSEMGALGEQIFGAVQRLDDEEVEQ